MDILNLLEVMKPASHVVLVKMQNGSDLWDSASKVLIAILPAFISFIALLFSYFQFKTNTRNTSKQYALGIQQQLMTLKLNTRLATEIELKKDVCKEVRAAFVGFLKHHAELYNAKAETLRLQDNNDAETSERISKLHEVIMSKSQLLIESKLLLDSYFDLNDPDDKEFFDQLNETTKIALTGGDGSGSDLGYSQGKCNRLCFKYIERRRKEITSLVDTIGN
ncbi:hypothetical protein UXO78_22780 [Enterobacter cloacae]|uniref:hypothetical protein n=1 Tax=Enterobacter cloacae complex TaxID=354276 RepID=UPI002005894B|nr:hypothetical protein [Enterobacter kobei]MCK7349285.1 hypothetical protein [Enterobacter kobei]